MVASACGSTFRSCSIAYGVDATEKVQPAVDLAPDAALSATRGVAV
jgi:hypothetical protein